MDCADCQEDDEDVVEDDPEDSVVPVADESSQEETKRMEMPQVRASSPC